jgi:hypothetical protein
MDDRLESGFGGWADEKIQTAREAPPLLGRKKSYPQHLTISPELSSSSIYSSIGQLMYNGASQEPAPTRVLVIPGVPGKKTRRILNRLEIEVMEYRWEGNEPKFSNIDQINKE